MPEPSPGDFRPALAVLTDVGYDRPGRADLRNASPAPLAAGAAGRREVQPGAGPRAIAHRRAAGGRHSAASPASLMTSPRLASSSATMRVASSASAQRIPKPRSAMKV